LRVYEWSAAHLMLSAACSSSNTASRWIAFTAGPSWSGGPRTQPILPFAQGLLADMGASDALLLT